MSGNESDSSPRVAAQVLTYFSYGFFASMALFSAVGLLVSFAGLGLLPFLNHIGLPLFPGTVGRVVAAVFSLLFAAELVHSLLKLRAQLRRA